VANALTLSGRKCHISDRSGGGQGPNTARRVALGQPRGSEQTLAAKIARDGEVEQQVAIAHANGLLANELTNCCTLLSPTLSLVCVFGDYTKTVHSQCLKAFTTTGFSD